MREDEGRWSIHIDIDGFSAGWERDDQVLLSLGELMRGIFRLGRRCFPLDPKRLFAHQFGDGFVIVSDFHEESLERCLDIAVSLMRHVATSHCFARASIAEGSLSDIQGCYPKEVLDCLEGDHQVSLHMGLMTITPVMGTALIRAVNIGKRAPKGPLLIVESSKLDRLGPFARYENLPPTSAQSEPLLAIDWVHMQSPGIVELQKTAPLNAPSASEIKGMLDAYCARTNAPKPWQEGAYRFACIP